MGNRKIILFLPNLHFNCRFFPKNVQVVFGNNIKTCELVPSKAGNRSKQQLETLITDNAVEIGIPRHTDVIQHKS